jgi:Concanavalin A-like lectin/glucanases superfamily/The GLUG motif
MTTLKSAAKNSHKKAQETQKTNWFFSLLFLFFLCLFAANCAFAYSGGTGEPNNPYQIADVNNLLQLAADTGNYDKFFILTADINLTGYDFNNAVISPYTIDEYRNRYGYSFYGSFDGAGHKISNLTINAGENTDRLGLFGETYYVYNEDWSSGELVIYQSEIKNLTLENVNISSNQDGSSIGNLIGCNNGVPLTNCHSNGNIILNDELIYHDNGGSFGGLVGTNSGDISNCSSEGNVFITFYCYTNADLSAGGLFGRNFDADIIESNSDCNIICYGYNLNTWDGYIWLGGLVGENYGELHNSFIDKCYSTGIVTAYIPPRFSIEIGGLAGENVEEPSYANISKCFSTSPVTVTVATGDNVNMGQKIGGLVGNNLAEINDCYSTGPVTGLGSIYYDDFVGGLVGYNGGALATIRHCYSVGKVDATGSEYVGGLVGSQYESSIINSYFLDTSGPDNGIGTDLNDVQMKQQASFVDWDFMNVWWIIEGITYPQLRWFSSSGPGPTGSWDFEESSGTTIYDSSGNGHDGNIIGAERITDSVRGKCLHFDGSDDYVSIPDVPDLNITGEITISAWVYFASGGGSSQGIVTKTAGNGASNNPFDFRTESGYLTLVRADASGYDYVYSTQTVPINQWHHVLVRVDSNKVPDFYIDGVVTGKTVNSFTRTPTGNTSPLLIGKRYDGLYFKGHIDDVMIFPAALSSQEIQWLYYDGLSNKAFNPTPNDGEISVEPNVVLSWFPGKDVVTHDVYFGTDFNEVNNADVCDSNVYMGYREVNEWDTNSHYPSGLNFNTTYYWRIDENSIQGTTKGNVWNFTTLIEPNIVGWWTLKEGVGNTAWDSTGHGYNGSIVGATWFNNPVYLSFDGINDYVSVANNSALNITGDITISAWVYLTRTSTEGIVEKTAGNGATNSPFDFRTNGGKLALVRSDASGHEYVYDSNTVPLNNWHHVLVRVENKVVKFYIDGSFTGTTGTLTKNPTVNSRPLYIGRRDDGLYLAGRVQSVRVYNHALSPADIWSLYQSGP